MKMLNHLLRCMRACVRGFAVGMICIAGVGIIWAQAGSGQLSSAPSAAMISPYAMSVQSQIAVPPEYTLGPGDVIAVSVYNARELDRVVTLGSRGDIVLDYLDKPLYISGLTVTVVARKLSSALRKNQILISPQLGVRVIAVNSRPVSVAGAVVHPQILQAAYPMTLLEALLRAQGLNTHAGDRVLLTMPAELKGRVEGYNHKQQYIAQEFPLARVMEGTIPADNPVLYGNDFIQVLPRGEIFVAGDVKKPGAFKMPVGQSLNAAKAMALAGSWKMGADPSRAIVVRTLSNGSVHVMHVNLPRVLARKAPDLQLRANDILYVPTDGFRTAGIYTIRGLASSSFLGLAYALSRL